MRGVVLALLLIAAPAVAAPRAEPEVAAKTAQAEVAALKAENAALRERAEVEKRLATLEGAQAEASRADAQQANLIALLGGLIGLLTAVITIAVFFFTFRATREAVAAARDVAKTEAREEAKKQVATARSEFERLAEQERASIEESKQRLAEVNVRADEVNDQLAEVRKMADAAKASASAARGFAEGAASEHARAKRSASELEQDAQTRLAKVTNRTGESERAELTLKDAGVIAEAVAANDQPENQWTVRQFENAIGKALYVDKDWHEALRLATAMKAVHAADTEAQLFALRALGNAARELSRFDQALDAYRAAMAITTADPPKRWEQHYIWVAHCAALCLTGLGRAAEAEAQLRALLPLYERVIGAEGSGTLVTRHSLASAILNQGRAAEAEVMWRELLPLWERVDGAASSGTYIIRSCWAEALVRSDRPGEAREVLAPIPDRVPNEDWLPRHEAGLAFVRARVADAFGERAAAEGYLARAQKIYGEIYPPDHIRRRELEEYIANRPGPSA